MKTYLNANPPWSSCCRAAGFCLLLGSLVLTGCHKKTPPAVVDSPTPSLDAAKSDTTDRPPAPTPNAPIAGGPLTAPNGQPDLGELNRTLLRWVLGHRRTPANFEDFAATAGVAIPPPPAGQKYIIAKNMHIQLVNQ